MHYNWSWHVFLAPSPDGEGTYLYLLLLGLVVTLITAMAAWIVAFAMGCVIGTARTLPLRSVRYTAGCYVEIFRNIPLLVQMFIWYFVVPELVPQQFGVWLKSMPEASFVTAVVALGFYTSSSVAVQVAAGINARPRGQTMASMALGLTLSQTYRYVVLPMALRTIIPSLANDLTSTIKNTSVALTIGLLELTARAKAMQEFSFHVFEAYSAAAVGYVLINLIVVNMMRGLERKVAVPGFMGGPDHMSPQ